MSKENPEVVRWPFRLKPRPHRSVEERLALRFPRLAASLAAAAFRLPLRSRLRRAVLKREVSLGWEAMNRFDLESGLAFYHRDVESVYDGRGRALGFQDASGREERWAMLKGVYAEFSAFRFEPDEMIDLGDRLLSIGRMKGTGAGSGAPFDTEFANLWTISGGLVIRDQQFFDWMEALEAAGLPE